MQTIDKNISSFEAQFRAQRQAGPMTEAQENRHFAVFNAYYRLICSISLKNIKDTARNSMKTFLKKGVSLELLFSTSNFTPSLRPKLLQFINKLSNSQVVEYIRELIESKEEGEFGIVFDFIKHPHSSSLRERLCREELLLTKSMAQRTFTEPQQNLLNWNLILKETCKYCPYYVQDVNKFYHFFEVFYLNRNVPVTLENIYLEEFKEINMKVICYFVCANKKDMDCRNFYISNFLEEKCFNFGLRIEPYLASLNEPSDFRDYLEVLKILAKDAITNKGRHCRGQAQQPRRYGAVLHQQDYRVAPG
jgi:hypothetical protein